MKKFIANYWKTLLFFAVVGVVGGFFTGIFLLDSYPVEIQQELLAQGMNDMMLGLVTAVQSAGYGIILGAIGIILAKKIGLWKDERSISRNPLIITIAIGIIGGLVMILSDIFFFGQYSEAIINSYAEKPTVVFVLASVTYGAVIEEVMLRLFWMSLIAFVFYKLFEKKKDKPSTAVLVLANVITALIFAAGHLSATFMLLGNEPLIIFRCFLMNGGLGLLFGFLYRKYGLRYAMMAHGGCHIVSKLIWILFI
jgi:membrane protease YdiL (CAAX protease family)